MKKLLCAVVTTALAGTAQAAGFAVDVQSGRGTGVAAAMTALTDDASGIFYNAAAIARGRGLDVQLGDTLLFPAFNLTTGAGQPVSGLRNVIPPPHLYASYGITDAWTVGLGVFSPYGLGVTWPSDYPGRFIVTGADFRTYYVNPTVAYRYGPLRVGAGVDVVRATVDLKKKVNLTLLGAEPDVELGAGAWGVGGNVGAQVEVLSGMLTFGAHYRSTVSLAFDGDAHFNNVPPAFQGSLFDQKVKTTFQLPDSIQLGVAFRPLKSLAIAFDAWYFGWQRFGAIDIEFAQTTSLNAASFEAKSWRHTWNYHLGAEYAVNEHWQARLGFLYDPSPGPVETLLPDIPDADRLNFAAGVGYRRGMFRADLGYQFIDFLNRTSTSQREVSSGFNPATYSTTAHLVALTLGVKL